MVFYGVLSKFVYIYVLVLVCVCVCVCVSMCVSVLWHVYAQSDALLL